jgi:Amt family ammonium transporter
MDRQGRPAYFVGVVEDVTERLRAEELLKQQAANLQQANKNLEESRNKAEAANRAKTEFLANMSHEIRTPMTAILGFADILLDDSLSEETVESAQIIKRNGEHLLSIINDILDLSKIEAGKYTVDLQKASPKQIAAEVLSLMKVRADAKALPLTLEVHGDVPETITTDPIRLRQILVNLVGNAIKFTEVGSVRVAMHFSCTVESEGKLTFDVIDTGIGMSEEQMSLLFQPFSQVDGSASRRFGGTGLGLAISKRLAEMLGGDIVVQSDPGQGSTFSLSIGTGKLNWAITGEPSKSSTAKEATDKTSMKLNCRILLAEDGPDNQRLIAFLLRKAGAEVEIAENGQIALDLALAADRAGKPFDVILMDMQMPVMDGYQATHNLRIAGHNGPILALTAHAMPEDRQKCIAVGCDDYIPKPIDPKKLVDALKAWIVKEPSVA